MGNLSSNKHVRNITHRGKELGLGHVGEETPGDIPISTWDGAHYGSGWPIIGQPPTVAYGATERVWDPSTNRVYQNVYPDTSGNYITPDWSDIGLVATGLSALTSYVNIASPPNAYSAWPVIYGSTTTGILSPPTIAGTSPGVGDGLPTRSIVGAQVTDVYLNELTGETFQCLDATFGQQVWKGSQGTNVPIQYNVLLSTHPDLAAMYTMDNIVGNSIVDETGNGYDAIHTGTPATTNGKFNNALDTNVSGSGHATAIDVLSDADTTGALCSWVRYSGVTGWMENAQLLGAGSSGIYMEGSAAANRLDVYVRNHNGGAIVTFNISSAGIFDGNYHFIVLQSNGSSYEIYIDNVERSKNIISGSNSGGWWDAVRAGEIDKTGDIRLGDNQWDGVTDHVRYFRRSLTLAEITELYNETVDIITPLSILATDHPNLVTMYTMDNIVGSTLVDESPNGNDSTIADTTVSGLLGSAMSPNTYSNIIGTTALSSVNSAQRFSKSMWIHEPTNAPTSTTRVIAQLYKEGSPNQWVRFKWGNSGSGPYSACCLEISDDGGTAEYSTNLNSYVPLGIWHHVAITHTPSMYEIYIDGVLRDSFAPTTTLAYAFTLLDIKNSYGGSVATAQLDQFRLFDRVVTPSEVTELFMEGAEFYKLGFKFELGNAFTTEAPVYGVSIPSLTKIGGFTVDDGGYLSLPLSARAESPNLALAGAGVPSSGAMTIRFKPIDGTSSTLFSFERASGGYYIFKLLYNYANQRFEFKRQYNGFANTDMYFDYTVTPGTEYFVAFQSNGGGSSYTLNVNNTIVPATTTINGTGSSGGDNGYWLSNNGSSHTIYVGSTGDASLVKDFRMYNGRQLYPAEIEYLAAN